MIELVFANEYHSTGKKTPFVAFFRLKIDHLTKTGLGQTSGNSKKRVVFSYSGAAPYLRPKVVCAAGQRADCRAVQWLSWLHGTIRRQLCDRSEENRHASPRF